MERLSDTAIEIINELHTERLDYSSEYIPLIDAANSLAAYEDLMERWKLRSIEEADRIFQRVNALGGTDLMAQYRAIGSIDHLRDLLQAEQDGRLVVLPCKTKETVYVVGEKRIIECFIAEVYIDDARGLEYMVSFDCDNDCDGCPFNSWRQDYSGEYSCDGEYGDGCILGSEFGKTVFLTREEAVAALKGGEG